MGGLSQTSDTPPITKKMECVSYTPFRGSESPTDFANGLVISESRLREDIQLLSSHFSCIRVYSATGLELLPPLLSEFNMQVMLGVWIGRNPVLNAAEIMKALVLVAKYPEQIKSIVVGNEALLRQDINGVMLAALIKEVQSAVKGIPVTYADVWEFWQKNPSIAPAVDFITIHILPYWENAPPSVEKAIEHVVDVRLKLGEEFGNKDIFIGETGWPSFGRQRAGAKPSVYNQALFIRGFIDQAQTHGWHYNLIEAFDQPWKRRSEGGVGGYWGLWSESRNIKGWSDSVIAKNPHWQNHFYSSFILVFLYCLPILFVQQISLKQFLFGILSVTVSSYFLVYQFYEYQLLARDAAEWLQAGLLLYMAGLLPFLTYLMGDKKWYLDSLSKCVGDLLAGRSYQITVVSLLYWLFVGFMAYQTILFIFDGRYRMYPLANFVWPALFFCWLPFNTGSKESSREFAYLFFMILLAASLLFVEPLSNEVALCWVAAFMLLMFPQMRNTNLSDMLMSLRQHVRAFGFVYLFAILGLVIRFGVFESPETAGVCVASVRPGWCHLFSAMGLLIHFGSFSQFGVVSVAIYLLTKRMIWLWLAKLFVVMGLILYGAEKSAPILLILLVISTWPRESIFRNPETQTLSPQQK